MSMCTYIYMLCRYDGSLIDAATQRQANAKEKNRDHVGFVSLSNCEHQTEAGNDLTTLKVKHRGACVSCPTAPSNAMHKR